MKGLGLYYHCLREFYLIKWKREIEGYNLTITTELELLELAIDLN